jgi:outer membrane autotransporter protein
VRFDLVNDGGSIAPGRGIGTTNVAGNITLERGALVIDVRRGASDTLRASGDVRLGGTLRIEPYDGYQPRTGDSWTLIVADGGVRGRFDRVTEGYSVNVVGSRVIVTYGEVLECVAARDAKFCSLLDIACATG